MNCLKIIEAVLRRLLLGSVWLAMGVMPGVLLSVERDSARKPNIVFVLIDDMGYGDLSVYRKSGHPGPETTNLDRLASEGVRFTRFYANSPICSPSRVAAITGQYPQRWNIYGHMDSRERNRERGMPDWLFPDAVTLPGLLREAGYATGHFGKWHMGGGRDVGDAPEPAAYGFDESLVSFEGLGDRLLHNEHGLSDQSANLGRGEIRRVDKHRTTELYAEHALDFIERHSEEPFYVQLWLNNVHDPFRPSQEQLAEIEAPDLPNPDQWRRFFAVLAEMDRRLGRFVEAIDDLGLREETLIVVMSDHGPTAWPRYYREGQGERGAPGYTAGLRGRKWSLYEGGVRVPFFVRWPGRIPAGRVNDVTVGTATDLLPSLCAIAGVPLPDDYRSDGEDLSAAILGESEPIRGRPVFWEYNSFGGNLQPFLEPDRSPHLAMLAGTWKLLMNPDGSAQELYDLAGDRSESNNLAERYPHRADRMGRELLRWYHDDLPEAKHGVGKPSIDRDRLPWRDEIERERID